MVTNSQRFSKEHPCPICGGFDQQDRGQGVRCYGFLSGRGSTANCTRSELANGLALNQKSDTYPHKLQGQCGCGVVHGPAARVQEPSHSKIVATYDYQDEQGHLLYQVVRMHPKRFVQRKPLANGEWDWSTRGVRKVLYRLPELLASHQTEWVFLVEGEKDADRLAGLGLVATTNPGGAGKWSKSYTDTLKTRHVVIIPDNDPELPDKPATSMRGQRHARQVAVCLQPVAATVRVLELEGLPPKGDVSDWIDQDPENHTGEALRKLAINCPKLTPQYTELDTRADFAELPPWASKYHPWALQVIERMRSKGYFLESDDQHYYFDQETRRLMHLASLQMRVLLRRREDINATEKIYNYLVEEMTTEAEINPTPATITRFAYYDSERDLIYMDMGDGQVLRLDGETAVAIENGSDGVIFDSARDSAWTYHPDAPDGIFYNYMVAPISFVDGDLTPFSSTEQRLLFLMWLLCFAFETELPTKPVTLLMGPNGSGKTFLLRVVGRVLRGRNFEVTTIEREEEKDFWTLVTNSPYVVIDNADTYVRWFDDALASLATGVAKSRRVLHTTNSLATFRAVCFVAISARTPRFRRPDVAQRLLPFALAPLEDFESERRLMGRIMEQRDLLLSDYANQLNRILRQKTRPTIGRSIRLADFAQVAARIGAALDRQEETSGLLDKLRQVQSAYGTEENPLWLALDYWLDQNHFPEGAMHGIGSIANDGREIPSRELFTELRQAADALGVRWDCDNPQALGHRLRELAPSLKNFVKLEQIRDSRTRKWIITRLKVDEFSEDSDP